MEVLKDLAGAEDLLLDAELPAIVVQSRGGNDYNITKINADTIPYTGTFGQSGMQSIKAKIDTSLESIDTSLESIDTSLELRNSASRDTIVDLKLENGSVFNTINVLGYHTPGDGGGGTFYWDSTSTESDNGGTIIQATGITTGRWKRGYSGAVNVKWFGAKGDWNGTTGTDDTVAIQKANTFKSVDYGNGEYYVTSTIDMPYETIGSFKIIGNIKWSFKKEAQQIGKVIATTIEIDSVMHSRFEFLKATTLTLYSTNATWGVFWNKFEKIYCNIIINLDMGQSVNQNSFNDVYGYLHIKGLNTTGIRESHSNIFNSIDTTGANITATDGQTGFHILNESNLNQTNMILNWYAEATGLRKIKGNFNVMADNVDSTDNPCFVKRENFRLGSRVQGRQSSYIPMAVNNLAVGGDWSKLSTLGFPLSLAGSFMSMSPVTNSPDGAIFGAKTPGTVDFVSFTISYKLTTSSHVTATVFVYQEGTPSSACEIYGGGVLQSSGVGSYTPLGGNWYLLRISGNSKVIDTAAGHTTGTIRIYTTTSTPFTSATFRIITSYFVTTESIVALPSLAFGKKEAYGTTAPTAGTWSLGDICNHTAPTAGGYLGWVCTTAGLPGTWKTFGAISA